MARKATVGFETGGPETDGAYLLAYQPQTDNPRTGTYYLQLGAATHWSYQLGENLTEFYGRVAIRFTGISVPKDLSCIKFVNSTGATIGWLLYTGATQTWSFSINGTDKLATGNTVMAPDRWYILEFYFKVNASGQFTLKIDAVTDLTYSGNTGATNCRAIWFYGISDHIGIDDFAINDTTGAFQNSYPGLGGVFFLKPNADGAVVEMTPSAGLDHYAMVDETPANTTDWMQGDASGEQELFAIENTPEYITQIDVVQPVFTAALLVSGSNELRDIVRDGSTIYSGDTTVTVVSIAPAFVFYRGKIYYEQPDGTSGAFDSTALDALQVGVEIP